VVFGDVRYNEYLCEVKYKLKKTMKHRGIGLIILLFSFLNLHVTELPAQKQMMFGDTTRVGRPFSKDPHIVDFQGKYLMYYSVPPANASQGWGIGIAESKNLKSWTVIGAINPQTEYEAKGLCAPGALVRNDTVHLFYQTYGNGPKDAICHAWSVDGVNFTRNATNPIYSPVGDWNCGRAIDAEVVFFNNQYYLYYASRTPDYVTQIVGVATAPANTSFSKSEWTNPVDKAILVPKYPWEGKCIEGSSVIQKGDKLFMFYAGAYNNDPQQVGVAVSSDGINWERLSNKPFLTNGDPGTWNSSESGHPHIFQDRKGKTHLFFQGNNDRGHTWLISNIRVYWNKEGYPYLK